MPAAKTATRPKRAPKVEAPSTALADAMAEAEADALAASVVPEAPRIPLYWHSNAPWVGSGYGTQSALMLPLISQHLNYRCAFGAFHGLRGSRLGWRSPLTGETFTVYPGSRDLHANDVLGAHVNHWFEGEGGIVVALTDPWVIHSSIAARLPLVAWTPVDHDPIIPRLREWFQKSNAIPLAMSRFGERMLKAEGFDRVMYVPHGFNPQVFKPADRKEARRALNIPTDAFVVGMTAANLGSPSRKSFSQAIDAVGRFQRKHPDCLFYLHTNLQVPDGEDLPAQLRANNVKVMASDQYGLALGAPDSLVAALYSSFDVLLNPSMGEGFGLTTLEAQACGTPCIVTDFSAMPEVAPASAGNWNVGGQKTWTGFGSYQVTPHIEEIDAALEEAYAEDTEARTQRRISVFNHANQNYRADLLVPVWKRVLEDAAIHFSYRDQLMGDVE